MNELIAKLEAATKGSRELDLDLWWECKANRGSSNSPMPEDYRRSNLKMNDAPRYTTSLDAAMTLVPEGWSIGLGDLRSYNPIIWRAHLRDHNNPSASTRDWKEGHAPTPALALCIAALKARNTP
jgi:hypothetical protein